MLRHLGLGGDGDEIDALSAIEREFAVTLAPADVGRFETAGDVWAALTSQLRLDEIEAAPHWPRFAAALCFESGADPEQLEESTRLLAEPLAEVLKRAIRDLAGRQ